MKDANRFLSRRGFIASSLLGGLGATFFRSNRVEAAPTPTITPQIIVNTFQVPNLILPELSNSSTLVGFITEFEVKNAASQVEITFQGRIGIQSFSSSAGALIGLTVEYSLLQSGGVTMIHFSDAGKMVPVTFSGYWQNLSVGTHKLDMIAATKDGSATNVQVNPGTWMSCVVFVKEYLPFGATYLPAIMK